jgi:L-fuconolactonase
MRIDAHQHFWFYDPVRYSWITEEMQAIQWDFLPRALKPLLDEHRMDGCVAVQADQSELETGILVGFAHDHSWVKGVVGWVDLLGEELEDRLAHWKQFEAFKGVRHILQAEPRGFMTAAPFLKGLRTLARHDLTYDILTTEDQLEEAWDMVRALPEMKLVMDHISKPRIREASFDHWARYMKLFAERDYITVKLSGLVTEANWKQWTQADFAPYLDFCLENFGPRRLMFGSDWPVCLLAGHYEAVIQIVETAIADLSEDERTWIMGQTAVDFYNLI